MNGFQFPGLVLCSGPRVLQHKNQNNCPPEKKPYLNRPTPLHFRFYFSFNKPTEHNPLLFQFSCSIFTITSVLVTETSGPLTFPTLSSSVSLAQSPPSPSLFHVELMAHHFNLLLPMPLSTLTFLLPDKTPTLGQMKELFHFYTSATSEDNKLTGVEK